MWAYQRDIQWYNYFWFPLTHFLKTVYYSLSTASKDGGNVFVILSKMS